MRKRLACAIGGLAVLLAVGAARAIAQTGGSAGECPTGGAWRQLDLAPDLEQWPIVRDIGAANRRSGLQRVMQARLCEKAGDYERAANYYQEARSLLVEAIPQDLQEELLTRAAALRSRTQPPIGAGPRIDR